MRRKYFLSVLLLALVFLAGCTFITSRSDYSHTAKTEQNTTIPNAVPLALDEVKQALLSTGLTLTPTDQLVPADYAVNGLQPVIFAVNPDQHLLLLYEYPSIAERVESGQQITGSISTTLHLPEKWTVRGYAAKNFVLVDMTYYGDYFSSNLSKSLASSELITDLVTETARLQKAVATLNETKTAVFTAGGVAWDARLTVRYFQYWYKDNSGALHIAQDSQGEWKVKYLGNDPKSIKSISYEYTSPNGSGSRNESGSNILRQSGGDYYLPWGSSDNVGIPTGDAVYTLKIKWDGHTENMTMKPTRS